MPTSRDLAIFVPTTTLTTRTVTVFGYNYRLYNNPTGRCQSCGDSQGCCAADEFDITSCFGNDYCDSFFTYCLQTIGSTGSGCTYFGSRTSDNNRNDASLDFSQSMVLDLENPIILQRLTDTYTVMSLVHIIIIKHTINLSAPYQVYMLLINVTYSLIDISV